MHLARHLVAVSSLWIVQGCGGAPAPAPAPPPPAVAPAPPPEPEPDPVAELAAIRDAACACTEPTCVDAVQQDFNGFLEKYRDYAGNDEQAEAVSGIASEMASCMMNASGRTSMWDEGGGSGSGAWTGTTGIPACDEYVVLMERYLACDKVPPAARDGARQGLDALKEGWGDLTGMPEEAKQAANDGCAQANEALRQSAAAMGCAL